MHVLARAQHSFNIMYEGVWKGQFFMMAFV